MRVDLRVRVALRADQTAASVDVLTVNPVIALSLGAAVAGDGCFRTTAAGAASVEVLSDVGFRAHRGVLIAPKSAPGVGACGVDLLAHRNDGGEAAVCAGGVHCLHPAELGGRVVMTGVDQTKGDESADLLGIGRIAREANGGRATGSVAEIHATITAARGEGCAARAVGELNFFEVARTGVAHPELTAGGLSGELGGLSDLKLEVSCGRHLGHAHGLAVGTPTGEGALCVRCLNQAQR